MVFAMIVARYGTPIAQVSCEYTNMRHNGHKYLVLMHIIILWIINRSTDRKY